ncbi:MAG: zinc-ribbon domain-containing protein [Syntrophales bacterium]
MWTDHMPLKGKCPTPDCEWQYDIYEELKKGTSRRLRESKKAILCPHCGAPITSRFSFCRRCGHLVTGPTAWGRNFLLISLAFIILAISVAIYRYTR